MRRDERRDDRDANRASDGRPEQAGWSEDLRLPLEGRAKLRRNYVALLVPVLLVAFVVSLGFVGRIALPQAATRPSSAASGEVAGATTGPSGAGSAPRGATPGPVAPGTVVAEGHRVFFVSGGRQIEARDATADGTADTPSQTIASASRCQEIEQIAVAGDVLAYVVTSRPAPLVSTAPLADGCAASDRIDWSIEAVDLTTGRLRTLASGTRAASSLFPGDQPVHLGLSADSFAYETPLDPHASAGTGTYRVEIRALADGRENWVTSVNAPVASLMLGGTRLAIVTQGMAPQVLVADERNSTVRLVSSVSTGASLSADGRYLAYDSGEPAAARTLAYAMLLDIDNGRVTNLGNIVGRDAFSRVQPAIGSARDGSVIVAWYARLPNGRTGVRFVDSVHPDGIWLGGAPAPAWMSMQGDDLIWLQDGLQGTEVGSIDLPTTTLATAKP